MDIEERHRIVDLIEAAIVADGVITDEEREFLGRVIERFGLSAADRSHRGATTTGRSTATLRTFPADVQLRVLALLVDAAVVDGRVAPEEHALLLASAATLGIEAVALEERIAQRLRAHARPYEPADSK